MREIVGATIGTFVTNNPASIIAALNNKQGRKMLEFLDRDKARRMARIFPRWEAIASGPTLFIMDENGEPIAKE